MVEVLICRLDRNTGLLPAPSVPKNIYRVSQSTQIQFQLESGSPLITPTTSLLIDLDKYQDLPPRQISGTTNSFGHWTAEVEFSSPGNFNFCLEYTNNLNQSIKTEINWIIVDPIITLGDETIPFNGLCLQSLLSRCLGPISNWSEILKHQRSLGFNIFHLCPIQELGGSLSHYSISDPTRLSPELFPGMEDEEEKYAALCCVLESLDKENGIGCVVDIVLNHCANGSPFIEEHPEAAYNLTNSPWMRVAYELDKALVKLSNDISRKALRGYMNENKVETEEDLKSIMKILKVDIVPGLLLFQYFQIDVEDAYLKFIENESEGFLNADDYQRDYYENLSSFIENYSLFGEGEGIFSTKVDNQLVWKYCKSQNWSNEVALEKVKQSLTEVNSNLLSRYEKHLEDIYWNIETEIKFRILHQKNNVIKWNNPLIREYFMQLHNGEVVLFNGWIMGYDKILKDFAEKDGWHYFRRNVHIWGDCVKLRYGASREDCPILWDRMEAYVTSMARIFKGIRLDNAHGTPINVSEYMLNKARKINPNLLVIGELFTGNVRMDTYFVNRLGLNALVREAMNAHNPSHFGNLLYEYGEGALSPVGKIEEFELENKSLLGISQSKVGPVKLTSSPVSVFLYDCTHDNETPAQKRTLQDSLPNAALIAMTNCALASTRGYDEYVPKTLSVANEHRIYKLPGNEGIQEPKIKIGEGDGISIRIEIRDNPILENCTSVDIKGAWDDWKNPIRLLKTDLNRFSATLIFRKSDLGKSYQFKFIIDETNWIYDPKQKCITLDGITNNEINVDQSQCYATFYENMWPAREIINKLHTKLAKKGYSEMFIQKESEDVHLIMRQNPANLKSYVIIGRSAYWNNPNSIALGEVKLPGIIDKICLLALQNPSNKEYIPDPVHIDGLKAVLEVESNYLRFFTINRRENEKIDCLSMHNVPQGFIAIIKTKMLDNDPISRLHEIYRTLNDYENCKEIFEDLSLEDINHLLWRCNSEELAISHHQRQVYTVAKYKPLNFAGIGGIVGELMNVRELDNLVYDNIRSGDWLIDYFITRTKSYPLPEKLANFLCGGYDYIKKLPHSIKPQHLMKFSKLLFRNVKLHTLKSILNRSPLSFENDSLLEKLCLSISQFWGSISNDPHKCTLAAGLPFLASEDNRIFGRDTLIALKGLFLCTSMYKQAKDILLYFASLVKNGLIPNIANQSRTRYNSRDTTWLFLQRIIDYISIVPDGKTILNEEVQLKYPSASQTQKVQDIIQYILQAHASGMFFIEEGAGPELDSRMKDEGFNIEINLDPNTGFIYGGNRWNCGTWMDILGSSDKADNRFTPASPRDGAPIELTALLYSVISSLLKLNEQGIYPYSEVKLSKGKSLTFAIWKRNIEYSFENFYYSNGFYKDTVKSQVPELETQIRPNVCIAMAFAPELFNKDHAIEALGQIETDLLPLLGKGQLGIKTLNESDPRYAHFVDFHNDSNEFNIAHGFSLHNGPEWLWPFGYYLIAAKIFNYKTPVEIIQSLKDHRDYIEKSTWMSLPAFTNDRGHHCAFSCDAQASSVGTLLEVFYEIREQTN